MDTKKIKGFLKDKDETQVNNYIAYLQSVLTKKKKQNGQRIIANPWMEKRTEEYLARIFKAVEADHLVFDGVDITLQSTGVSYSYQAYKNRMFYAYPESIIDLSLVYKDDSFTFKKESGRVKYVHDIANPFAQKDQDIIGGYCVIKNKRGEFLTTLTRAGIDKHRKVAKTDYIWKAWFVEMALKTIIKKACKTHFKDSFTTIETLDNENYDVEKVTMGISDKQYDTLIDLLSETPLSEEDFLKTAQVKRLKDIQKDDYSMLVSYLKARVENVD